ncbi:MAG: aldehyde dehydrogenase family protein [Janthinobacterium lividum]
MAVVAAFANCGQICTAGSRLFLQRPIVEQVMEHILRKMAALRLGDSPIPPRTLARLLLSRSRRSIR